MPGVLIVEALAQVGAVAYSKKRKIKGVLLFLLALTIADLNVKSHQATHYVSKLKSRDLRGAMGKGKAIATVDGEIVCETEITVCTRSSCYFGRVSLQHSNFVKMEKMVSLHSARVL